MNKNLVITTQKNQLRVKFSAELTLYNIASFEKLLLKLNFQDIKTLVIDLESVSYIDTAAAIFLENFRKEVSLKEVEVSFICSNKQHLATLALVNKSKKKTDSLEQSDQKKHFIKAYLDKVYNYYIGFVSFIEFFGRVFATILYYLKSFQHIRFKEIAFEINESAIKAIGIVALTSFLIGLVVAYQSAYQLKLYGANIFIVDMLGISILRELAPLITAIVIAGRSGSAFTAQIGAMKITQELDAMKTMGFDPYVFLVMPRIIALMIALPLLIFIADIMGILGGMIVSNINLGISSNLFLDRFHEVVDAKHFFIGILKGPFFAFLIASIGIYRGLVVKDDTQSIGFNTTKSVVESIFAVIVCDALFSIAFTNLGI
jgi:phospholipid/cholesterol/gamma-HCH transport system permease protein